MNKMVHFRNCTTWFKKLHFSFGANSGGFWNDKKAFSPLSFLVICPSSCGSTHLPSTPLQSQQSWIHALTEYVASLNYKQFVVTHCEIIKWIVISSEKNWRLQLNVSISMFWSSIQFKLLYSSGESSSSVEDQSILIKTLSCNLRFFSELISTQLRISHGITAHGL